MNSNRILFGALALATLAVLAFLPWGELVRDAHGLQEAQKVQGAPDSTDFDEVRREMYELGQALGKYGSGQRDKALDRSRKALEALDHRLEALEQSIEDNWDEMSEAARERSRQAMRELRRQRVVLAEKFGNLQSATESAWEQMRKGFLDAFSVLNDAWEKSIEEFQKDQGVEEGITL